MWVLLCAVQADLIVVLLCAVQAGLIVVLLCAVQAGLIVVLLCAVQAGLIVGFVVRVIILFVHIEDALSLSQNDLIVLLIGFLACLTVKVFSLDIIPNCTHIGRCKE